MHEARPGDVRERLAHSVLDAEAIDVAHREDKCVQPLEQLPLAVVEGADADQSHAARHNRRQVPAVSLEPLARQAQRGGKHHPVDVATRARLRAVQVAVGVDPDHASRPVHAVQPAERPERDRVVAAEDDRNRPVAGGIRHELGDVSARLLDLRQEAGVLVAGVDGLRHRRADVAAVGVGIAEALDPGVEPGVADRGRAHVDTAAPGPEVEGGPDDRDLPAWLHRHGRQG